MDKWSRGKMKEIAKIRMKANYWKAVLTALILMVIAGGIGGASSAGTSSTFRDRHNTNEYQVTESADADRSDTHSDESKDVTGVTDLLEEIRTWDFYQVFYVGIVMAILFLAVMTVVLLIGVFIGNPLLVGGARFFSQNLDRNAEVKEICYTFDRDYKNTVRIMFFRDLYTFLWTLLFIIPGIIKGYEYSLIPYLLAEKSDMSKEEAFAESKRLMQGNKWRAFILDLSFLPWLLLSGITFGLAGVFYVNPYINSVGAAFYQALKEEDLYRVTTEA